MIGFFSKTLNGMKIILKDSASMSLMPRQNDYPTMVTIRFSGYVKHDFFDGRADIRINLVTKNEDDDPKDIIFSIEDEFIQKLLKNLSELELVLEGEYPYNETINCINQLRIPKKQQ